MSEDIKFNADDFWAAAEYARYNRKGVEVVGDDVFADMSESKICVKSFAGPFFIRTDITPEYARSFGEALIHAADKIEGESK